MKRTTPRGFRVYEEIDPAGEGRARLFVVESSVAFEGAHVRVYHGDEEHVHLDVEEAKATAKALLEFVADAEAGSLTEPARREGE